MTQAAFHPTFSLAVLETQMNAFTALWGGLVTIDHQDGNTIAVYDDTVPAAAIALRPGAAVALPGKAVISTGDVYVLGNLLTVTAYG